MIEVSICIATFRRPDGLLRLLRSLARLDPASPTHEIIVADNDDARSGEPAVRQACAEGIAVQYVVEPRRGIPQARNRAVAPARGAYVAFIDDDEVADPDWLVELFGEVRRHDADAGIGPVLPVYPAGTPHWIAAAGLFDRPRPPTGTQLDRRGTRTGNALINRRALAALDGPFDERFGLFGGEDTDLFMRLHAGGCRIIAVDSAVVHEHLPPHRARVSWLLRRAFHHGVASARIYAATTEGVSRPLERRKWVTSALRPGCAGLLLLPVAPGRGVPELMFAARCLGRAAFYSGFEFQPYARDSYR